MLETDDTIFALSSGGLPSGVAVVRLSGPAAIVTAGKLVHALPPARRAAVRSIRNRNGLVIDQGVVIVFPGPESFTGEDCVELQVHGSKAVIASLLGELAASPGCRLAEHGEFSRRALDNGRMDLVEVEGLADLLAAETEMQRRLAIEHVSGGLSALYDGWASRITRGRALIEAELDFSDEGDVPGSVSDRVWAEMGLIRDELAGHLGGAGIGEIVRDGFKVALVGAPNSGKSSLLNALARRDVAIVTDIPGTTRDVLEVNLDLEGFAVRLYDTAGLRLTDDIAEQEGIRRARKAIIEADFVLVLTEIGTIVPSELPEITGPKLLVGTKSDRYGTDPELDICISIHNPQSLVALQERLLDELRRRSEGLSLALPARQRHRQLLADTLVALDAAVSGDHGALDVRAEDMRVAAQSLGRITGRVDVEDLLGVIFSEFCIGK